MVIRTPSSSSFHAERKTLMTRTLFPSFGLVLILLAGCADLSQTSRSYSDDMLYGLGPVNKSTGSSAHSPLVGDGWEGVY